jgi:hypothetical protein
MERGEMSKESLIEEPSFMLKEDQESGGLSQALVQLDHDIIPHPLMLQAEELKSQKEQEMEEEEAPREDEELVRYI